VFLDVKSIGDPGGSGEEFLGRVPDPRRQVGHGSGAFGLGEAAKADLAQHPLSEL
jgi:hypothetical protein